MAQINNSVPNDWSLVVDRVAEHTPDDDVELLTFMEGEASAMVAYSEGVNSMTEALIEGIGLDPDAVQGIIDLAEAIAECAAKMTEAEARFRDVYAPVMEFVADGHKIPYNGRFFTGEGGAAA